MTFTSDAKPIVIGGISRIANESEPIRASVTRPGPTDTNACAELPVRNQLRFVIAAVIDLDSGTPIT